MKNKIPNTDKEALDFLSKFAPLPPYELGFKNRNLILETSLVIEKSSSLFLAALLGITNPQESLTLGNRNSSFSLKQKIDLLIDIGALSNVNKNKYIAFMEIRNVFMHVFDANSFVNCFKHLDKKEKFLFKLYPQDKNKTDEEKLRDASVELASDVLIITYDLMNKVIRKFQDENILSEIPEFIKTIENNNNKINNLIESISLLNINSNK